MAFNIATLPDFIDQSAELVAKALASAKSFKVLAVQAGNKGKASLNNFSSTITFQDGTSCGWNASGNDAVSQRILETAALKVQKNFCEQDLEGIYLQTKLKYGANYTDVQFADELTGFITKAIAAEAEKALWQAEEGVGVGNLSFFDGFLTVLDETAGVIDLSGSVSAPNIIDTVNAVYAALPAAILDQEDLGIFMGSDTFRTWTMALTKANLYHYTTDGGAAIQELYLPGTNVKVYALPGLTGTNAIIGGQRSNFVIGTDLESDFETFDLWYSKDNQEVRFDSRFRLGVQTRWPDQVVYNQAA